MILRYAPVLVLLAACSPEGGNASGPAKTATPAATATTAAAADTPVTVGASKAFGDWYVGCDNLKTCQMVNLGDELGNEPVAGLTITRAGGPDGGFQVSFGDGEQRSVSVDGKTVAQKAAEYPGATGAGIVAAMVNGRAMQVAGGAKSGAISLKGASAALRWIDDQQGRVGTVTAAVAKGDKPASRVPAAPAMPMVAGYRIADGGAKPTPAQTAEMTKIGDCDTSMMADASPESFKAGDGATIFLAPCSSGAYNMYANVFVLKDGKLTQVRADAAAASSEGEQPAPMQVVNGDVEDGLLGSYEKGRGVGDCSTTQKFAWDGTRMRLVEQRNMDECRGTLEQVTTWRAKAELK